MCQLLFMVRVTGLEPVRRETHAPQTCLSAYSSMLALLKQLLYYNLLFPFCQPLFQKKCLFFCVFSVSVTIFHFSRNALALFNAAKFLSSALKPFCVQPPDTKTPLNSRQYSPYGLKALYIRLSVSHFLAVSTSRQSAYN